MKTFLSFFALACGITAADQASKALAEKKIPEWQRHELLKGRLAFTNVQNTGAAYGLLAGNPKLLWLFTGLTLVGISAKYYEIAKESRMDGAYALSAACIAGGAAGNIIDRARKGYVTDFIQVKYPGGKPSPIFNLADFFVAVGMIICLIKDLQE